MIAASKRLPAPKLITLTLLLLAAGPALACKLPVFRYALERWNVDRYRLVALVTEETDTTVVDALALLRSLDSRELNLEVDVIDLDSLSEEQWWQLEGVDEDAVNRLQVHFPGKQGEAVLGWTGELTSENVRAWIDSPLRQTLIEDLVDGASAVWLQIDGEDEVQNTHVAAKLQAALDQASSEMEIPAGVIARDEAADYLQQHPEASMDDVLRSDVPLKIEFRSHRVSRTDPKEWATVAMIDGLRGQNNQPVLVPVFGRGRMLDAIAGENINPDVIVNACRYMVGECSCTVKALNPGADLLLRVDWQQNLGADWMVVAPSAEQTPISVEIPKGGTGDSSPDLSATARLPAVSRLPVDRFLLEKRVGASGLLLVVLGCIWFGITRWRRLA